MRTKDDVKQEMIDAINKGLRELEEITTLDIVECCINVVERNTWTSKIKELHVNYIDITFK